MTQVNHDAAGNHRVSGLLLLLAGAALLVNCMPLSLLNAARTAAPCIPAALPPEKPYNGYGLENVYLAVCITRSELQVGEQAEIVIRPVNYAPQFPDMQANFRGWMLRQTDASGQPVNLLRMVRQETRVDNFDISLVMTVEALQSGSAHLSVEVQAYVYPPEILLTDALQSLESRAFAVQIR